MLMHSIQHLFIQGALFVHLDTIIGYIAIITTTTICNLVEPHSPLGVAHEEVCTQERRAHCNRDRFSQGGECRNVALEELQNSAVRAQNGLKDPKRWKGDRFQFRLVESIYGSFSV